MEYNFEEWMEIDKTLKKKDNSVKFETTIREACGKVRGSKEYLAQRNIASEMEAVKKALAWFYKYEINDRDRSEYKVYTIIICDYYGLVAWPSGEWRANNKYTRAYRDKIEYYRSKFPFLLQHIKGHFRNKGNDRADELAKMGSKGERLIRIKF